MLHRLTVVIVAITLVNIISGENTTNAPKENVKERNKTAGDYSFSYSVKDESTGDFKSQEETRQGNSVRGSYTVADPNGSLRTVTYTAGEGKGFQAVVDFKKKDKMNSPRGLNTDMEMMSPKRRPKPKKPMGNDIGIARVLKSDVKLTPGGYVMDISSKPAEDLKTTVSVDFTQKNETKDPVEEEISEVFESMPKLPELDSSDNSTHLAFEKDPEEVSLDERITQVARQLAETSLRREFEEKKLGHNFPITLQENEEKSGKAFESPAKPLPLISRLPPETAQLQLITEVQSVPQPIYKEGFFPATPSPELSGPLLGGPPLKKETTENPDAKPEGKNLKMDQNVRYVAPITTVPLRIPAFLRFMIPGPEPKEQVYPVFLNIAPFPVKYGRNYIYKDDYYPRSKAGFMNV